MPNRKTVQSEFQAEGIPTAVHYPIPLNKQPAINQLDIKLPHAEKAAEHVLSLPMHPYLEDAEQRLIIEKLCKHDQ